MVVSETPDDPEPGRVETVSDGFRLRLGGLLEGTLGRDPSGNMVGIPRARLRAEALVSTTLEAGFVTEVDVSPWSSPTLKEDGPGMVRDVYVRLALGNRKLLDLGEVRLGYFTLPQLAEQWEAQSEKLWLTGTLGREAWLPGRELAVAYEGGGYRFGVPLRGMAGLATGVDAKMSAAQTPGGAAGVPLTAGATGPQVVNPSLSGRLEVEPFWRWTRTPRVAVGGGALARPLEAGNGARVAFAGDLQVTWPLFTARVSGVMADTTRLSAMDARSLSVEGAVHVIPDFADLRGRYEVAYGPLGLEGHRVNVGLALFYLDAPAAAPLSALGPLLFGPAYGRALTLLWIRSYDLMRLDGTAFRPGEPVGANPTPEQWVGHGRWLLAGDTDQLVVRVTL
jgi:hypothetical protein